MSNPGFTEYADFSRQYKNDSTDILFELDEPLVYTSLVGSTYIVPEGFNSDLGTIPRVLWGLLPPHEFPSSYILHDYLCVNDWISRKDGDKLLLESLPFCHCPEWKAKLIYNAVRGYAITHFIK